MQRLMVVWTCFAMLVLGTLVTLLVRVLWPGC
jgi:hypothetical protein